jgi:putative hydrolase of the HAD superfamily
MKSLQHLIFDADDTLWDNNSIYLSTTQKFIDLGLTAGIPMSQMESDFEELEKKVVAELGYGSENFIYILEHLFKDYSELSQDQNHTKEFQNILDNFEQKINNQPKEFQNILDNFEQKINNQPAVFPHVKSTLNKLSTKYELYVLTKGNIEEQKKKLIRSDLTPFFKNTFVETEKNLDTYKRILKLKRWEPHTVCMIGNSPKSDINPSLQVGMYAIFIPYAYTWKLEDESLIKHPRLISLNNFSDLLTLLL